MLTVGNVLCCLTGPWALAVVSAAVLAAATHTIGQVLHWLASNVLPAPSMLAAMPAASLAAAIH